MASDASGAGIAGGGSMGWGLVQVCGPEAPADLIEDMLEEQETSPDFANFLRDRWADLVAECA